MTTLNATLKVKRHARGLVFWFLWYAATFVGGILYFIPVGAVQIPLGLDRLGDYQHVSQMAVWMQVLAAVLCGAACGSTIGLAQWLVLRRELKRAGLWVVATVAGYASIGVLPLIAGAFQPGWSDWAFTLILNGKMHWLARVVADWPAAAWPPGALTLTLFGAVLGFAQWLMLRRRVYQAGWWIAISTGGWACATLAVALITSPFWIVSASWDVPVIIGGAGMFWLLRRAAPTLQTSG